MTQAYIVCSKLQTWRQCKTLSLFTGKCSQIIMLHNLNLYVPLTSPRTCNQALSVE